VARQLVHTVCVFHGCQIKLIFSHFNLGNFSQPDPPGEKLVYQRRHLPNSSAVGTESFSRLQKINDQFQRVLVTIIIITFYEASIMFLYFIALLYFSNSPLR
jgi:hypothetical protein